MRMPRFRLTVYGVMVAVALLTTEVLFGFGAMVLTGPQEQGDPPPNPAAAWAALNFLAALVVATATYIARARSKAASRPPRVPRTRLTWVRHMTIQRLMVVIAILAIPMAAGRIVGPDVYRRWVNCRDRARGHASESQWYRRLAATGDSSSAIIQAIEEEERSAEYYRALWLPWRFYVLGN